MINTKPLPSGHRIVVTLEKEFLNDPSMSEIVDGQFRILGKIVKVVNDDSESINLLRRGIIGAMKTDHLDKLFRNLEQSFENTNFQIPKMQYQVYGPVIQVLPIAIYA